jgi:branched-chain amino acid transport system ATP-binding protein
MLLEVKGLHVAYGEVEAVHGVDFRVDQGELVSIVGANGAGKTTILRSLMGLQPSSAGSIRYHDEEIARRSAHERARAGIRLVPERARVFPQLSVRENLLMGAYGLRKKIPLKERLAWLFGLFPILEERQGQSGSTLSGGEQQQLAIARALISDPKLLLVDEVSMGLMPKMVEKVFRVLEGLNRERGLSILLVEQNAAASLKISTRAYILETGRVALEGEASVLSADSRVREAYLGV